MIRISQIDDELSIYKNNTVVLLGVDEGFEEMFDLLQYHGIEVNCICDNNKDNWGTTYQGLKVISPPELKKMIESEDSNIVVQVAIKDMDEVTIDLLSNMGSEAVISLDEFIDFSSSLRKKHGSNIRISQIDDELSIYKNNRVVLFGMGEGFEVIIELFKFYNIRIECICGSERNNWGEMHYNYPVISPHHLNHISNEYDIVVQVASKNIDTNIFDYIKTTSIKTVIGYSEAYNMLCYFSKKRLLSSCPQIISQLPQLPFEFRITKNLPIAIEYISKNISLKQFVFVCSLQKTGDMTIIETLKSNNIPVCFIEHTPEALDKNLIKNITQKVKIIMGIRDPISQNLSFLYQHLSCIFYNSFLYHVRDDNGNFYNNEGDVQKIFEEGFDNLGKTNYINYIDNFFTRVDRNIINIYKYSFDKEKGYSIIKEGNIEVFIYQLERINDIVKEMSNWVGETPFDEWVISNEASSKWIANSYKQAQKEIRFTQEYFDNCYNDPWIKHFYSDEDIENFKQRWRPHIKD